MRVPFLDLKAQQSQILEEIQERITDIMSNTGFILGRHVDEFEKGFAEIHEAKFALGVSSGTDALHVALQALRLGPGDGVIVPVNTFIATAEAVSHCGATPVFVDCNRFYNVDVGKIEDLLRHRAQGAASFAKDTAAKGRHRENSAEVEKVRGEEGKEIEDEKVRRKEGEKGRRIRAIIPVHLYGQPANMSEIMALAEKYGVAVVEDACQAHLARYNGGCVGTMGQFGCFSFYPGKNLGAYGEAGAVITNDEELYQKAKMLRQHGEIERYNHKVIGHNYRMEAFQGAVLATKLKYIKEWTRMRQENALGYTERLKGVEGVETPEELEGTSCVYHLYVVQVDDRDGLQKYLGENGIASGLHYPIPLHLQEAYAHLGYKEGDFPVAERAAKRILSLPMYPELSKAQIDFVCEKIEEFIKRH